ncbi:MAG: hypothetical protein V2A70_00905 [Candidatus Omnitrophota bacterium]
MEKINDLNLLILDSEKIIKMTKMFSRLPEILTVIKTAEIRVTEMEKMQKQIEERIKGRQAELDRNSIELDKASVQLAGIKKEIDDGNKELGRIGNKIKEEYAIKVSEADKEIGATKAEIQKEIETLKANAKIEKKAIKDSISAAEKDMKEKEKASAARIATLKAEEEDAKAKLESVRMALAELRNRL